MISTRGGLIGFLVATLACTATRAPTDCRSVADCPSGSRCTDGACRTAARPVAAVVPVDAVEAFALVTLDGSASYGPSAVAPRTAGPRDGPVTAEPPRDS